MTPVSEWNFFSIIDANDDDPALYPVLSGPEARFPIALEAQDGAQPSYYTATAATVLGTDASGSLVRTVTLPSDLKWEILVTDCRVVVYCVKFDKGGGWGGFGLGGLAIALAANAVSKARAAGRRKGKLLVAQVRYPWLQQALATPKVDWRTANKIRLRVDASPGGAHRYTMLELTLGKQTDPLPICHEIAVRAARYRLTSDASMGQEEREGFEQLARTAVRHPAEPTSARKATWAVYAMPSNYRVNRATAYPKPASGMIPSPAAAPPAMAIPPRPTTPPPVAAPPVAAP